MGFVETIVARQNGLISVSFSTTAQRVVPRGGATKNRHLFFFLDKPAESAGLPSENK